jgi:hypothetical protein
MSAGNFLEPAYRFHSRIDFNPSDRAKARASANERLGFSVPSQSIQLTHPVFAYVDLARSEYQQVAFLTLTTFAIQRLISASIFGQRREPLRRIAAAFAPRANQPSSPNHAPYKHERGLLVYPVEVVRRKQTSATPSAMSV